MNIQGPLEGEAALQQMSNTDTGYMVGRAVFHGLIPQVVGGFATIILLVVWFPPVYRALKNVWIKNQKEDAA
jgi:hypothetical protein